MLVNWHELVCWLEISTVAEFSRPDGNLSASLQVSIASLLAVEVINTFSNRHFAEKAV